MTIIRRPGIVAGLLCALVPFFWVPRAPAQGLRQAAFSRDFVAYQQSLVAIRPADRQLQDAGPNRGLGHRPAPVDLSHLSSQLTGSGRLAPLADAAPASFDWRTANPAKLPAVRNQGPYGTCWAHASFAAMESFLRTGENPDYSERHIAFTHGWDWDYNSGGNQWISTAYLSRWAGPVDEADCSYTAMPTAPNGGLTVRKHLQEALFYPAPEPTDAAAMELLKNAIMANGALYVSYYHDDANYNSTNRAYYYKGSLSGNHAVAVVGWDDNFAASKFNAAPAGNGAWLIRNSWGSGWGDGGYFYLSYYDAVFRKNIPTLFSGIAATGNYGRVHDYDPLGWVNNLGYGPGNTTMWGANVFFLSGNEIIRAAGIYTVDRNVGYEIRVYRNLASSSPDSGTLCGIGTSGATLVSGTFNEAGYHTVAFPTAVLLTAPQNFSVVLKLTNSASGYPIAYEYALAGFTSAASASANQSFYSATGSAWSDLNGFDATANFCIKAFADVPAVPDITLSATSVLENRGVNSTLGTLGTTAPAGGSFTYSLVAGTGDGDNASFNILAGSLRVNGPFDFETKKVYNIRVRSVESGGQWLEKAFPIEVIDVNEPPVAVDDVATTAQDTPVFIPVLDNDTDPEGTQLQISSPAQACIFVVGVNCPLYYVPASGFCGMDTVSYTVTDGEYTASAQVTVTVTCPPDTTAPETKAAPLGGTYQTAQSVTLNCDDGLGGSGCAGTSYCRGTGCMPATPYSGGGIEIAATTDLRFASIDAAGNAEEVRTESYTICTFELAPASVSLPASADMGSFTVTAPAGCSWSADETDTWISITNGTGGSGSGSGTVRFSVTANKAAIPRSGSITVGDDQVTIHQAGQPLIASFVGIVNGTAYESPYGPAPLTVMFDGGGSSGPNPIASCHWEFGDGESADSAAPENTTVEHAYSATGSYFVTLTITDSAGQTDSTQRIVSVADLVQYAATSVELQVALNAAEGNGKHDIIRLAGGTYQQLVAAEADGNPLPFSHVSTENKDLIIEGGWTPDFSQRASNIPTQLQGAVPPALGGNGGVLRLTAVGGVTVDGVIVSGGDTTVEGGGLYVRTSGPIVVGNSRVLENATSGAGGGLYLESTGGGVWLYGSTIAGNSGASAGGGMVKGLSGYLFTNEVSGNTASAADGGLQATVGAGGELIVSNNTIYGNKAVAGGSGLTVAATGAGAVGLLDVHNNIVFGNDNGTPATAADLVVTPDCDYLRDYLDLNIVNNSLASSAICPDYLLADGSNVSVDFGGRGAGDIRLTAADAELIDRGTEYNAPWEDFEGDAIPLDGDAVVGAVADIGADEYNPANVAGPAAMTVGVSGTIATVGGSATLTVTLDQPAKRDLVVYLASSDPAVVTPVSPYLRILKGLSSAPAVVQACGSGLHGSATITATDPSGRIAPGSAIVTVSINTAPTLGTVTPSPVTSAPETAQSFSAVFSDADGAADLKQVRMLVSPGRYFVNSIYVSYDRVKNKLYLRDDANTSWGTGVTPGPGAAVLSNGQGTIEGCSVTVSGNSLTLNVTVRPNATFASLTKKNLYLNATDLAAATTGLVDKGDWTIFSNVAPTAGTVTPSPWTSAPDALQEFSAVFSDANGSKDIKLAKLLINSTVVFKYAIGLSYNRIKNKLYLRNDTNTGWSAGVTPGAGMPPLENGQGTIESCTVTSSGNELTLNVGIRPKAGFAAAKKKNVYLYARDKSNAPVNWVDRGDWTIY